VFRQTYPERSTVWQSDREIGEDSKQAIRQWRAERQVMGNLVDSQEQILVGGGSDHVCCSQELPIEDRSITEEVCAGDL
jgi:hypothetical protein